MGSLLQPDLYSQERIVSVLPDTVSALELIWLAWCLKPCLELHVRMHEVCNT